MVQIANVKEILHCIVGVFYSKSPHPSSQAIGEPSFSLAYAKMAKSLNNVSVGGVFKHKILSYKRKILKKKEKYSKKMFTLSSLLFKFFIQL